MLRTLQRRVQQTFRLRKRGIVWQRASLHLDVLTSKWKRKIFLQNNQKKCIVIGSTKVTKQWNHLGYSISMYGPPAKNKRRASGFIPPVAHHIYATFLFKSLVRGTSSNDFKY
jgi:hypothetical protein